MEGGLSELMDLQESIFKLQVDVQAEISEAKRGLSKDAASLHYVSELRRLRKLARKLGDAAAWTVLLLDRQVIHSLRDNQAVPIPSRFDNHHRAMFDFVHSMISREWGIPIVHDITDILRVGDVTYVRPTGHQDPLAQYATMELKISPGVPVEGSDDKLLEYSVQVHSITKEPIAQPAHVVTTEPTPAAVRRQELQARHNSPRIARQLQRMRNAVDGQAAEFYKMSKVGDAHVFTVRTEGDPEPHWNLLRRAMRQARSQGNASFSLGGFVSYTVVYNAAGLTETDFQPESMVASIKEIMPSARRTGRDNLTVQLVSEPRDDDKHLPHVVLPMFLWAVPRRAIDDMIRFRMVVTAAWNMGALAELIEAEGMEVRPSPTGTDPRNYGVVVPLKWADGAGEYHLGVPWDDVMLAVREFRGPEAVLARLRAARDMTEHVSLTEFIEQSDTVGGGGNTSENVNDAG
ncbi:hypothetical protein D8Y23_08895 [Microbacterium enclense]|uniref:Uncharacterized protein n=2 Tax=Microbacterium enclense TaxID=993073 RepID=A0A443JEA0_9MICO|nr:hypothetical protein D8Y23_08895 [Microbacterium enclense]